MSETIIYEGKDISTNVKSMFQVHDMYIGNERADTLDLTFENDDPWRKWNPQAHEKIEYENGGTRTGLMFTYDIAPGSKSSIIHAQSLPNKLKENHTKTWEGVTLSGILGEIAGRCGCDYELMYMNDFIYPYMTQSNEPDIAFISKLARYEGAALIIFDNKILLVDEQKLESQEARCQIDITGSHYDLTEDHSHRIDEVTVTCGGFKGIHGGGGGSKKHLDSGNINASSDAECCRFAKGLHRHLNKNLTCLRLQIELRQEISAGITCTLEGDNIPAGWESKLFLHHIRHEYARKTSTLFLRKPLEGY